MTLPTFVVIGAMKAGTVSLRHYLADHPAVFLGVGGHVGEPNFFIAEYNWSRGQEWYESLFDEACEGAAVGECSPNYAMAHRYEDVPRRMAQLFPNLRLVYVVRDPIARMQSMYLHQVSAGRERRPVELALRDDHYLGPSLYGLQVATFLEYFDRRQLLVVASEVLHERPREALRPVFLHLGVLPDAIDLDHQHRDHRSLDKPVPRLHAVKWLPRRGFKSNARSRPDERRGAYRALTTRPARAEDAAISSALRRELAARLGPDLELFEKSIGHAVPSEWRWSTPSA